MNVPKFSSKGGAENETNEFDFLDLNDIFASDFYPQEVDFSNLVWDCEHQSDSDLLSVNSESVKTPVNFVGRGAVQIPPSMPSIIVSKIEASNKRKSLSSASGPSKKGPKCEEVHNNNIEVNHIENGSGDRRERNREHAKQSRGRKKVLLDSLSDQLTLLREQNAKLRSVITENVAPQFASKILDDCTTADSSLLTDVTTGSGDQGVSLHGSAHIFQVSPLTANIASGAIGGKLGDSGTKVLMQPDYRLIQSLVASQQNFLLTDPSLPDNPIVYASNGFCKLTGYKRGDILGRNCRFLQGPGTDQVAVGLIRQGIIEDRDVSVCLLNYKADGTPFWNQFFLGALKDNSGKVVNFVGVQCEVNVVPVTEMKEKVKRMPIG